VSALIRVAPPSSLTHVATYFVIGETPSDAGGANVSVAERDSTSTVTSVGAPGTAAADATDAIPKLVPPKNINPAMQATPRVTALR